MTHLRLNEEAIRFTVHTVTVINVQLTVGGDWDVHSTTVFFNNLTEPLKGHEVSCAHNTLQRHVLYISETYIY